MAGMTPCEMSVATNEMGVNTCEVVKEGGEARSEGGIIVTRNRMKTH